MTHVTLKTIAEYTGMSVTTVSRALKDGDEVKGPTKDKIRAVAEELGYYPNLQGLSLRTGINYSICAVLPIIRTCDILGDVGTLALISGLTAGFDNTPFHLTIMPFENDKDDLKNLKYAVECNLAGGVIFNQTKTSDDRVSYLTEKKIPFVSFGQTEMSVEHPYVDFDNYDIGYRAASYLYEKGCKNIKLISSSMMYTYAWHKYFGVKRASMEYGIPFNKEKDIIIDTGVKNYRELAYELMTRSSDVPDGMICGTELSTLGVIAGIQDAGKQVNKDVHVISIEISDLASWFEPPVAGLRQDVKNIGTMLAKFIIQRVQGETDIKKLQYLEKATFIQR